MLALGTVKGRDPFEKEEMKDRIHQLQGEVYPTFGSMVSEIKENTELLTVMSFPILSAILREKQERKTVWK